MALIGSAPRAYSYHFGCSRGGVSGLSGLFERPELAGGRAVRCAFCFLAPTAAEDRFAACPNSSQSGKFAARCFFLLNFRCWEGVSGPEKQCFSHFGHRTVFLVTSSHEPMTTSPLHRYSIAIPSMDTLAYIEWLIS